LRAYNALEFVSATQNARLPTRHQSFSSLPSKDANLLLARIEIPFWHRHGCRIEGMDFAAGQKMQQSKLLTFLASYPPLVVTSSLLGLSGFLAAIEQWKTDHLTVVILVSGGIFLIGLAWSAVNALPHRKLPPVNAGQRFVPFLQLITEDELSTDDDRIVGRLDEAEEILAAITGQRTTNRYLLLCGKSGVGKSTLLRIDLRSLRSPHDYFIIDEFENIFITIIQAIRENVHALPQSQNEPGHAILDKSFRHLAEVHSSFKKGTTTPKTLDSAILSFIGCALENLEKNKRILIALDQSERLLTQFPDYERPGPGGQSILRLLQHIRDNPRLVLMFVIRNDSALELVSLLLQQATKKSIKTIDETIEVLLINGISTFNNDAFYNDLYIKFLAIDPLADFKHIEQSLSLNSPSKSNSFITQLTGYMADNFANENLAPGKSNPVDPELLEFIQGKNARASIALEKYFEFMIDGYTIETSDQNATRILSAILYSIACANRASGNPISDGQIARLAHMPFETVKRCLDYLQTTGAILKTRSLYRLTHDQLTDYILNSDSIDIRPDYREAIAHLAHRRDKFDSFILPERTNSIADVRWRNVNGFQISLLLMILFCTARIFFPERLFVLLSPVNRGLDWLIPGVVQSFDFRWEYYVPIYMTQLLWVTFMYYLDRGYFQYSLRRGKMLAAANAPLGGLVGCLVAFAPSLFLVPIIVGGIGLSLLYLFHAKLQSTRNAVRKNSLELAGKTAFNMLLTVGCTVILYFFLASGKQLSPDGQSLFVIWFFSAGFFWYWYAMSSRQGSQEGWSTLLAISDRSADPV
jgi:hypothetical protein